MKKQYLFGFVGLAIVLAFAIVGFMSLPASADTQDTTTNDVVSLGENMDSTNIGCGCGSETCTGSCAGNCDGTCGKASTCSLNPDNTCGSGSCGGGCAAAKTKTCGCQG